MSGVRQERFAVVGASGFIGRALVSRLHLEGAHVAAISRRGYGPGAVRVTSYLDQPALEAAIGEQCDALFHLAALAHRRDIDEPAFVHANVDTALSVARAAIERGVRRFVFVSSIGVIGSESHGAPFSEITSPTPVAPYARSKWQAEQALRALLEPTGIELVIVRPPLVHGPGAPGNFGRLARMACWPLPLGSVIDNGRSLVGIDNLVDFLLTASRHPAASGEVLLVTDGEDISTAALVRRLAVLAGGSARLIRVPPTLLELLARWTGRGEMARQLLGSLRIDASRSAALLGWTPPLSLDEGLAKTMDHRR